MGLTTDFNQSPYFDDFNEAKNYHKILFKPATALQARELTQLQTMLQNQVERFGDNILTEGTIVQGGNFVEETKLFYAKIRDIAKNSSEAEIPSDVNQYVGLKAVGLSSGVEAIVIATEYGLETQSPDLSTLFLKYTKTGSNDAKQFIAGEEVWLYVKDSNGDYTTQYHRITIAPLTVDTSPVGKSYGVRCGEGVIYQKGYFIKFTDALTIVSKYNRKPDGVVVGFQTNEYIIDSNADSTLLDNASGFNNEKAPGADRLQLIPELVAKSTAEAKEDDTFFAIQEYAFGKVVRRNTKTAYSTISSEMERRTAEESGDYVVNRFNVRTAPKKGNPTQLTAYISPGLAYVDGKRVELLNEIGLDIPDSTTFRNVVDQNINTNYGEWLSVTPTTIDGDGDPILGNFDFVNMETVNLKNGSNVTIGTAKIRALTKRSALEYRIYLANIKMNATKSFRDIRKVLSSTSTGDATINLVSGNAVLQDSKFTRSLFSLGKSFVKSIDEDATSYIHRASETRSVGTNSYVITLSGNNEFPYAKGEALSSDQLLDIIVIANTTQGVVITLNESLVVSSASLDATGKQLTINLTKTISSTISLTTHYTVRATNVSGVTKELKTVYVKINTASAGVGGYYNLGMPDLYSLEGVWLADTAVGWPALETAATNDSTTYNVSNYFTLVTGQNDSFYDHGAIKLKKSLSIDSTTYIIVKAKVFYRASTGNFSTVNSYPVDDDSTSLPANKIRTEHIPSYSATSGTKYDLRDMIDLRPYVTNTAAYAEVASSATINPASTIAFAGIKYPAPNQIVDTAFSYYLGRNDLIFIDQSGDFLLIKGKAAANPSFPPEPTNGMLVARLMVPAFPTLDPDTANKLGKPHYGVAIKSNQTQRYTMKDIGAIDQRIKNLEYYTSLSLLENSAKDFMVTDADGANRFKNGIFVDSFENLSLAKVGDGQFAASIDATEKNILPKVRQYPLALKWVTGSNTRRYSNKIASLTSSSSLVSSASQPYATAVKNCTTNFWNYSGQMVIFPEYDFGADTTIAPAVNIEIDLATPFVEYNEFLSEFLPMVRTTPGTTTTGSVTIGETINQNLGDFVTDLQIKPYIRGKEIEIKAVGLRPNTRMYFFFDGTSVDEHVAKAVDYDPISAPTTMEARLTGDGTDSTTNRMVERSSAWGAVVRSDSAGVVRAIFKIPDATFLVGERKLEILDVNDLNDRDAATTSASSNYNAFNYSISKTSMSTTTRMPQFDLIVTENIPPARRGGSDPVAQTFTIEEDASSDTHVFLTKLDLFFAKKSRAGNAVNVQIREVENGYPSGKALPFSSIRIPANVVNAPSASIATTAVNATTVVFEAPVALKTGKDYAIIIVPEANDPDYLVWIARTGEKDVDTQISIRQDVNTGVLFTSTNNKTWTPYQNENLKFNLYTANFNAAYGTVTLTNHDHEFFEITATNGKFKNGEDVVIKKNSYLTGTVSVTDGSNVVSGSGTSFTSEYSIGQAIVIVNGSDVEMYKISAINSNTSLSIYGVSRNIMSGKSHYKSPTGKMVYVNLNDDPRMILEGSDATSGKVFANGQTVVGVTSNATADINLTSLNMSYIQPMLNRLNFSKTELTVDLSLKASGGLMVSEDLGFGDTKYLTDDTYRISSKSADPNNRSFELVFGLYNTSSTTKDTSPIIDFDTSSVIVGEYVINNSTTDVSERKSLGQAQARYIAKVVQLADGMDAQDMRVILGAYKPVGTDIKVYAKFKSAYDPRNFNSIEWTRMYVKPETNSTSSTANRNDWREFEYGIGTTALGDGEGAWESSGTINYTDPDGALYNDYKYFAVKIVMLADSYNVVPRLKDLRVLALS